LPFESLASAAKNGIALHLGFHLVTVEAPQFCISRRRLLCGLQRIDVLPENFYVSEAVCLRGADRKCDERHNEKNPTHRLSVPLVCQVRIVSGLG